MKHTISILVENHAGVLSRVSGLSSIWRCLKRNFAFRCRLRPPGIVPEASSPFCTVSFICAHIFFR